MNAFKTVKQIKHIKRSGQKEDGPRRNVRRVMKSSPFKVVFKRSPLFRFLKPRVVHTAEIIDISSSGLRARYIAVDKWSSQFDHISITDHAGVSVIDDIYCKIITDTPGPNRQYGDYARVCGVKFESLSDLQQEQLTRFIQEHTVDPSELNSWHVQFN